MQRLLTTAGALAVSGALAGAQENAHDRDLLEQHHRLVRDLNNESRDTLLLLLDDKSCWTREAAETLLIERCKMNIRQNLHVEDMAARLRKAAGMSLEVKRRTEKIEAAMNAEKVRLDFITPSRFEAPRSWRKNNWNVNGEQFVRALHAQTGPLNIQHTSLFFLNNEVLYEREGTFWEVFNSIQRSNGQKLIPTTHKYGSLGVITDAYNERPRSVDRTMMASVEPKKLPGFICVDLNAEPRFFVTACTSIHASLLLRDGRSFVLENGKNDAELRNMLVFAIPKEVAIDGQTAILRLTAEITGRQNTSTVVPFTDYKYEGENYTAEWKYFPLQGPERWRIRMTKKPPSECQIPSIAQHSGWILQGRDNLPVPPLAFDRTFENPFDLLPSTFVFPASIDFRNPGSSATEEFSFVLKNVALSAPRAQSYEAILELPKIFRPKE